MAKVLLTTRDFRTEKEARVLEKLVENFPLAREGEAQEVVQTAIDELATFDLQWQPHLTAKVMLCADLMAQGWSLEIVAKRIWGQPVLHQDHTESSRPLKRDQLLASRSSQLLESSVRDFVKKMESGHWFNGRRWSIFDLMQDGREVAREGLEGVIPYVQVIEPAARCEFTGFILTDVWRYFRHTWTTPNEPIPGRSMQMLVRDAGHNGHPVIGISALSSAAAALGMRDDYIGWSNTSFWSRVSSDPSAKLARWLVGVVDAAIEDVFTQDFVERGEFTMSSEPKAIIGTLRERAILAKRMHHEGVQSYNYKRLQERAKTDSDWEELARTPLYTKKRADELINLLDLKSRLGRLARSPTKSELEEFLQTGGARSTISRVMRIARSRKVGTEIADLTTCGAIAPYNQIAGGKLVAALSVSPIAIKAYQSRYSRKVSVIASSMAGRSIVRDARLAFIGTSTLYGIRPNQYDRITIPGTKGAENVRFRFRGRTQGMGTFQFGANTLAALKHCTDSPVNNVFGEGTSPKLRALRHALDSLGFDSQILLMHGQGRCYYGVKLLSNTLEYLLGMDQTPKYLFDMRRVSTEETRIVEWWKSRWAGPRISKAKVVSSLKQHTKVFPVRHGARVELPESLKDVQSDLFPEWR